MILTELKTRRDKIRALMAAHHIDAALISCNVNLLYTYGQIINGYLYLPLHAPARIFVKRPNTLSGEFVYPIHKPEQITGILRENNIEAPATLMLEGDELSFVEYSRLAALFPNSKVVNGTPLIREARMIKTEMEIESFRRAGIAHARAYNRIPSVFHEGMTDIQLSIEIERLMRLEGCLGIFRTFGRSMEIFMGSLLAGDNAAAPSPFDFGLGGEGADNALPISANGTVLEAGLCVMADYAGNFNGYMTDMSRVYSVGEPGSKAREAHRICLDVQEEVIAMAKPGVACGDMYNAAIALVNKTAYADYFMGHRQKARFVGHGIGLEINEPPVIAPRVRTELEPGMVIALEPKIILPGIGPVGVENSWVVTKEGVEKLTLCEEQIVDLTENTPETPE